MKRKTVSGKVLTLLLLIPICYTLLVPSIVASEIEKIDKTTRFGGTLYYLAYGPGKLPIPIMIEEHVYAEEVKGDNVILRMDVVTMNITDPDKPNKLEDFCYNKTYVINKFTLENVQDAPEADKPRVGYDPLYPSNLEAGEDIPNVWLDNLNCTGTLEFKEIVVQKGVTLYKYFVNVTITKEMYLPFPIALIRNCTLISAKTVLIEPLSGLQAYTENEDLTVYMIRKKWGLDPLKLLDLTYRTAVLPGDVNGDGIVNIVDGVIVGIAFGSRPGGPNWNVLADLNEDNFISITDIVIWAIHFGKRWPYL